MPYLVAAPVLSGADIDAEEEPLAADVASEAEAEAIVLVGMTDPLGVIRPALALLVVVAIVLPPCANSVMLGIALPASVKRLFPATTVAERNFTSSLESVAVIGSPPVSSLPPTWFTVQVISTAFSL
jgi:hypothetical protein